MNLEIAFIGAGKMVSAIVHSILRGETFKPEQIACCSANDGTSEKLSMDTGIARFESVDQMLENSPPTLVWDVSLSNYLSSLKHSRKDGRLPDSFNHGRHHP